jgi:hypothetical protein
MAGAHQNLDARIASAPLVMVLRRFRPRSASRRRHRRRRVRAAVRAWPGTTTRCRRRQRGQHHPRHRLAAVEPGAHDSPAAICFEFGDIDGTGDAVRLQHPLGIAWAGGRLFIADTYNHKIRALESGYRPSDDVRGRRLPRADDAGASGHGSMSRAASARSATLCLLRIPTIHCVRRIEIATAHVSTIRIAMA